MLCSDQDVLFFSSWATSSYSASKSEIWLNTDSMPVMHTTDHQSWVRTALPRNALLLQLELQNALLPQCWDWCWWSWIPTIMRVVLARCYHRRDCWLLAWQDNFRCVCDCLCFFDLIGLLTPIRNSPKNGTALLSWQNCIFKKNIEDYSSFNAYNIKRGQRFQQGHRVFNLYIYVRFFLNINDA